MWGHDDWENSPYADTMRRHNQHQQHNQQRGFSTPYSSGMKDKSIVLLRENGDRMKFTLKYMDKEYFDVAKQHFPHTEDEVHIPEHFAHLTYGAPPFSPCVYTATTDYLQARWGRKLDDSDRTWLGAHPYAADGGVPREYMPTCVQQMLEPYGMGVSRINIRRGVLMVPASLFDWMLSLGCNPFAMTDHQTTNAEAAEKLGIPLAEANKMWRVEFSAEPLPCSITGEQNFSVPTGQTVKVGDKGGHARYLPPRGRFNDWFISCQLDSLERIEYFVPTPNPEYVPRRGDPSLSLSSVRRPDGQLLAVSAKKGYTSYWMSPEEAQALAEELAKAPATVTPPVTPTPQPVTTTVVGPRMQDLPVVRSKNTIDVLKLPRLYSTPPNQEVMCPVSGCRTKHTFPKGQSMRYLEKHDALLLYEWLCFSCRQRFTTTIGSTTKKEYRKYLREGLNEKPIAPPVQSGGAGQQQTFPGWCPTCAKQMDPAKIGPDGVCDTCWFHSDASPDPADAKPGVPPNGAAAPAATGAPVVAPGPTGLHTAFHCWGCSETYDEPSEEVDNTGFCRDCVSTAFEGIICPDKDCKQDLADLEYLPHFIGYDEDTNNFDWCCVKCATAMVFPDKEPDAAFIGAVTLSRVLAMPDSLDVKAQQELLSDWETIRTLLEEQWREEANDAPDDEAMMPAKCPQCTRPLGNTTCELVQREADGSIIFACTHDKGDGKPCGALMYVRPPLPEPPDTCPECKCSNSVVAPTLRSIAYTGMLIHGYHLYTQVYNCTMCTKNYLDMRKSSTKPSLHVEEARASR